MIKKLDRVFKAFCNQCNRRRKSRRDQLDLFQSNPSNSITFKIWTYILKIGFKKPIRKLEWSLKLRGTWLVTIIDKFNDRWQTCKRLKIITEYSHHLISTDQLEIPWNEVHFCCILWKLSSRPLPYLLHRHVVDVRSCAALQTRSWVHQKIGATLMARPNHDWYRGLLSKL